MIEKRQKSGAFDAAAIARIVAGTGDQPDSEEALAVDIADAATNLAEMETFKRMRAKGSRKLVTKTRKALERTGKLIARDPLLESTAADLSRINERLRHHEQWHTAHDRKGKNGREPTPTEYLAGEILPGIFERRFDLRVTFTRNRDDKPDGALIDFIEAALKEIGVNYSRESIARAITRLRE